MHCRKLLTLILPIAVGSSALWCQDVQFYVVSLHEISQTLSPSDTTWLRLNTAQRIEWASLRETALNELELIYKATDEASIPLHTSKVEALVQRSKELIAIAEANTTWVKDVIKNDLGLQPDLILNRDSFGKHPYIHSLNGFNKVDISPYIVDFSRNKKATPVTIGTSICLYYNVGKVCRADDINKASLDLGIWGIQAKIKSASAEAEASLKKGSISMEQYAEIRKLFTPKFMAIGAVTLPQNTLLPQFEMARHTTFKNVEFTICCDSIENYDPTMYRSPKIVDETDVVIKSLQEKNAEVSHMLDGHAP